MENFFLPAAGWRNSPDDGALHNNGAAGAYWSTTLFNPHTASGHQFTASYSNPAQNSFGLAQGPSVRCVR